jgi:hypothetical protein
MSLYGSSPYNVTGLTFFANNGAKGAQGPEGPQGPQGNPGYGPTGPTGYGVTFINFINSKINTVYTDGEVRSSETIGQLTGNYLLEITGTTGGNFSPLASTEQIFDQSIAYNEDGDANIFEIVRRLNFKNIKTNSAPFIKIEYKGPPSSPNQGEPGQTIKLTYDVFNLGASNVSGGPDGSLVINNPGNIQSGYTGTTYNISENAAGFGILNGAEQLVVVNPINLSSNRIQIWPIDPTIGSVFYLSGYLDISSIEPGRVSGHHIMIKRDLTTNSTKAFTLILPQEFYVSTVPNRLFYSTYELDSDLVLANFGTSGFKSKFTPNIIWQNSTYFCPSQKYDVVNFISIGSRYVGIPGIVNTDLNTEATISPVPTTFSCKPINYETFYRITFNPVSGICCKADCSCEDTYDFECSGYFYAGLTCGVSGPCSSLGACCLYSTDRSLVVPCQELTYCQCAQAASQSGLEYNWNKFTTLKKSCADFNCENAKNSIGACCDGNGGCQELTSDECLSLGYYFQGIGINCSTSDGLNVCYDGIGGCCDSGVTCESGITGSVCLSQFKTYFGDGTTCGQFNCSPAEIPCYSIIEGTQLTPGMEYEDGIVVGIFNPNNTTCFGGDIFSGLKTSYADLTGITKQNSTEYLSQYDYSGYGFDPTAICENDSDSYIILVSKHPVNLTDDKVLLDGSSNNHTFAWSNGSVSWGPLVNTSSFIVDEFENNNLQYKEGYIYDSQNETSSKLSLYQNSFLSCFSSRFDTNALTFIENRPVQSFNGNWTRNNGLYNTIRLVSSEYFYYNIGTSSDGATLSNYLPLSSEITAARALSIYNRYYPPQNISSTGWFIPSIDELSYISNSCRNTFTFNLNARLIELGYTPISGWHWSSTGAFDVSSNEGIYGVSGVTHGSKAWAVNIDVDGISENMEISKQARTEKYKVRPIKIIRCDKRSYQPTDANFKLWNIPILSESIIDNQ